MLKYLSLEINDINSETFYASAFGIKASSFLKIGVSLSYLSNFSGSQTLLILPYVGSVFIPPIRNLFMEIGYDVALIKPNFDIHDHWLIGIRYNLGLLEKQ